MRIIAGRLRGREITLGKHSRIRPATGFVREKLMSLYTPERLEAGGFLDLCAGTGLVGFEALSRGSRHVVFIEADAAAAAALRQTTERFDVAEEAAVLRCDARRCLGRASDVAQGRGAYSAVFLDAPYIPGMAQDILERSAYALRDPQTAAAFTPDCLLIARTPDALHVERMEGLTLLEQRRAGGRDKLWLFELGVPSGSGEPDAGSDEVPDEDAGSD